MGREETGSPRIALVGCGRVGDLHRERLIAQGAQIVAISDPDSDALAQMAARLPKRPRLFRSEQDLLAARLVDAVVLCTPHGRHAGQIDASLQAGVHVLCEKPLVAQAEAARAFIARARAQNRALFVAFTRRSRGHARYLEGAGALVGPVRHVAILRAQPWYQRHERTWRLREQEGGGFLLDAGASMVDLLLRLLPEPIERAEAELFRHGAADVDVRASVRLAFASGARAEMTLLGDATEEREQILVFGERGTVDWRWQEEGPRELLLRPAGEDAQVIDAASYRTLTPDAAFVSALRSGRRFDDESGLDLYDAATALPAIQLLETLYDDAIWR